VYERVIKKIKSYHETLGIGQVAEDKDFYFWELEKRLLQLDWLLPKIRKEMPRYFKALDNLFKNFFQNNKKRKGTHPSPLETLTESFYFFAFRVLDILKSGHIPGIKKFDCSGIRIVRNQLIVHPEGDVLNYSFAVIAGRGPVLKNARLVNRKNKKETVQDRGLFVNADELRRKLEAKFDSFMSNMRDGQIQKN